MSRVTMIAAVVLLVAGGGSVLAQQFSPAPPPIRRIARADLPGRVIFEQQCAPCHGTGPGADGSAYLPGTAALEAKYHWDKPPQLELRNDLPAPVLRVFVRRGSGAMPAFRPSELTNAQIDQIAEYLAATARLNGR